MIYPLFLSLYFGKQIDLESDPLKALLVTLAYLPSEDHVRLSDVKGEVTGKGYIAGGQLLKGQNWNGKRLTADKLFWPRATIREADRVIIYRPGDGNPLVCCYDLPEEGNSTNGDFVVEWASDGIFELLVRKE